MGQMSDQTVRTRFAPSPTGFLHVGGIRTALFAWLLARQRQGQFIVRLEDTDQAREVSGADQHILKSLRALGLEYDEGPDLDGPYGPYRQSLRLPIYQAWAKKLWEAGKAYADPYSPQEVETFRQQAKAAKKPFLFREHRPANPPAWDGSQPLRLKSQPQSYRWQDAIMGQQHSGPEVIDDFILIKSDGFPTYNFAHIIDDHLMKISHVIRSQEFLASVPKYLNLYEALAIKPPVLATVPYVMAPDGKKKLSKRDGAKDVLEYLAAGYLPEGLLNFIATLGWNDGTTQEIFTVPELVQKFSLDRVQHGGAHFDEQRLNWMNGVHIRQLDLDELYRRAADFWPPSAASYDAAYKKAVLGLTQERLKYLGELPALTNFFFEDLPVNLAMLSQHKQLKKFSHGALAELLTQVLSSLEASDFSSVDLTTRLNELLTKTDQKPAVLFSLVRLATTWAPASPGLAESLQVLGKTRSLARLRTSLDALGSATV